MPSQDPTRAAALVTTAGLLALILAGYMAVLWLSRARGGLLPWILPSVWLLGTSLACLWLRPMEHLGLWGRPRAWALALMCGALAAGVVAFALAWPPRAGGGTVAQGLALILLVPLAEELYFRGLLLDFLTRHLGRIAASALGSLLFGLLHQPQGLMVPMTVLAGALSLTALASRSVLWAAALHLAWNALAVLRTANMDQRLVFAVAACAALVAMAAVAAINARGHRTGAGEAPP